MITYVLDGKGSAIGTDSDPNSAAPTEARIFQVDKSDVYLAAADGTTITVSLWVKLKPFARWSAVFTGQAVTPGAIVTKQLVPTGADLFVQVTANTLVTKFCVGLIGQRGSV